MKFPENNLSKLLASMQPELHPEIYVFSTIPADQEQALNNEAIGWFREAEGTTVIINREAAMSLEMDYAYPSRVITLNVYSSLEAVGFLAIITDKLAAAGISVNVISGYYHDHLFVPVDQADQAIAILQQIMLESTGLPDQSTSMES
jgi:hypothetical protein